jgi:hypothetical protein
MQHILRIADHTVPKKVLQAYEKQGEKIGISWCIIVFKNRNKYRFPCIGGFSFQECQYISILPQKGCLCPLKPVSTKRILFISTKKPGCPPPLKPVGTKRVLFISFPGKNIREDRVLRYGAS